MKVSYTFLETPIKPASIPNSLKIDWSRLNLSMICFGVIWAAAQRGRGIALVRQGSLHHEIGFVDAARATAANQVYSWGINTSINIEVKDTSNAYVPIFGGRISDIAVGVERTGSAATVTVLDIYALGALAKLQKWIDRTDSFTAGRNNYIHKFACALNRYGITIVEALRYLQQFAQPDFSSDEIERTVKSAYNLNQSEHKTEFFKDAEPLYAVQQWKRQQLPLQDIKSQLITNYQITEGESSEPHINNINELSVHVDDVWQELILLFDESRHSVVPHVLPLPRRCVDAWITVRLYEFAATD